MTFLLFASCIPVKGFAQSIICDIQRNEYVPIPNVLYDILTKHASDTFEQLVEIYEDEETLTAYFGFLTENDYGFWTTAPELFPPISREWESPGIITNAIIDNNEHSNHNYSKLFGELEALGCNTIQLRYFTDITKDELLKIMEMTIKSRFAAINFVMPSSPDLDEEWLSGFCQKHLRVNQIILYNSNINDIKKVSGENSETSIYAEIIYTEEYINSATHCGIIHPAFFSIGLETFIEGQQYNSCLNRKLGIDVEGEIKNCPSLKTSYGNIKDTSLNKAIAKRGFKKLWTISKNRVEICKDCEFRYICTDCRAYTENPGDLYSKPLKCGYDPYTVTWKEWTTNPLKEKAMKYYAMDDLAQNH